MCQAHTCNCGNPGWEGAGMWCGKVSDIIIFIIIIIIIIVIIIIIAIIVIIIFIVIISNSISTFVIFTTMDLLHCQEI